MTEIDESNRHDRLLCHKSLFCRNPFDLRVLIVSPPDGRSTAGYGSSVGANSLMAKGTSRNPDNRAVYKIFGYFIGRETGLFHRQLIICNHSSLILEYVFGNAKSRNSK